MKERPQEVVVINRNTASTTLGIISLVCGALALLGGWVPFLGLLAIPIALVGGLFAGLGLIIALFKGFRGASMPLLGGAICVVATILPLFSTGYATVALADAEYDVSYEIDQHLRRNHE